MNVRNQLDAIKQTLKKTTSKELSILEQLKLSIALEQTEFGFANEDTPKVLNAFKKRMGITEFNLFVLEHNKKENNVDVSRNIIVRSIGLKGKKREED